MNIHELTRPVEDSLRTLKRRPWQWHKGRCGSCGTWLIEAIEHACGFCTRCLGVDG